MLAEVIFRKLPKTGIIVSEGPADEHFHLLKSDNEVILANEQAGRDYAKAIVEHRVGRAPALKLEMTIKQLIDEVDA